MVRERCARACVERGRQSGPSPATRSSGRCGSGRRASARTSERAPLDGTTRPANSTLSTAGRAAAPTAQKRRLGKRRARAYESCRPRRRCAARVRRRSAKTRSSRIARGDCARDGLAQVPDERERARARTVRAAVTSACHPQRPSPIATRADSAALRIEPVAVRTKRAVIVEVVHDARRVPAHRLQNAGIENVVHRDDVGYESRRAIARDGSAAAAAEGGSCSSLQLSHFAGTP